MKIIYIIIFVLIIVIIYLNKIKNRNENFDPSQPIIREGAINLLSSYNAMQMGNTTAKVNTINGALNLNGRIDISNNVSALNVVTNDISSNNIIVNNINLSNLDLTNNKVCLQNTNNCINPGLIKLYSDFNSPNSPYYNMYLADASNCKIYEYNVFRDSSHNYIPKRILSQFGGIYAKDPITYQAPTITSIGIGINANDLPQLAIANILTTPTPLYYTGTTTTQPIYSFPKPAYYFLPQSASSVTSFEQTENNASLGFKISIPQLPFKCQIIWIQVPLYNNVTTLDGKRNRSFRTTYTSDQNNFISNIIYATQKVRSTYMPDGGEYNSIDPTFFEYTQWVPIPINYDLMPSEKALYLSRHKTEAGNTNNTNSLFMISGIAFTTNPWSHCKITPFSIHYDLNNKNIPNPATTLSIDTVSDFVSINGKLFVTKLPLVKNGNDKMLYLDIVADDDSYVNANLLAVYVSKVNMDFLLPTNIFERSQNYNTLISNTTVKKLDNFIRTYDNPFARFFNSHRGHTYISTIIPSNMITDTFIYIILQSQITSGTSLSIREIGTHDLFPSL
jgi:hypothetical protein